MKVIITGGTGQLGRELIKTKPKNAEIYLWDRNKFNLYSKENIKKFIKSIIPDWIINCAAYTNVDQAEKEKELALKINGEVPENLARTLKELGGNLLQISTDFVFSGQENRPYKTNHEKNPINIYGLSKSIGEDNVLNTLGDNSQVIILRTSWLMGPVGNNFALKMLKLHKNQSEIKVVYDQVGAPTSTKNLAIACWNILLSKNLSNNLEFKDPILHWTNDGIASWYDIAYSIGEIGKRIGLLKKPALIKPIRSEDYFTPAKRPHYSVLDTFSTQSILDIKNNHWSLDLERDLYEIKKNKTF